MVFPSIVSSVRSLAAATLSAAAVACASPTTYDLILCGGTIVDSTGRAPYSGDVAIAGDRIAAVGQLGGALGLEEIDATGLMVAPGFIKHHPRLLRSHRQDWRRRNGAKSGKPATRSSTGTWCSSRVRP